MLMWSLLSHWETTFDVALHLQSWSIATKLGIQWHSSIGDIEESFLAPTILGKFLPPMSD